MLDRPSIRMRCKPLDPALRRNIRERRKGGGIGPEHAHDLVRSPQDQPLRGVFRPRAAERDQ
jgi:hypothetical protein